MDETRFEKVAALFEEARNIPAPERPQWLEGACDDEDVRREVLSLLKEHEAESLELDPNTRAEALRRWVGASLTSEGDGEWHPPSFEIPGFRILSLLGEGGMGSVYEAEQDRPRRTVALKVLRPHMDGSGVRRRFEQEADILARLQHPGIATVHAVGVAETELGSLPFFAMELVRGKTLNRHAAALSREDKLELVARIADAVAHAHQEGVVHRDLKPSNILVDENGMPRVLDFGIARVTNSDVQATRQTDVGQVIGTLAYMSPEQAAGRPEDIDERSDVYSLGVIAFELLSGHLPREVAGLPFPEALRILMDGETTTLRHFDRSLGGDIDTIVTKALAGEKERRYASIGEFADDLRRFLRSEPIRARKATALYHLGRFVRRHRLVSGLLIALFVVLVVGTVTSTSLFFEARSKAEELSWGNYTATVESVSTSMRAGEGKEADVLLETCPEQHRDWEWEWLASRANGSLRIFESPDAPGLSGRSFIRAVAIDSSGERIVSATSPTGSFGGEEQRLRVWSREGELLNTMELAGMVFDIAFAHDGQSFATIAWSPAAQNFVTPRETLVWSLDQETPVAKAELGGFFVAPWPEEEGLWVIAHERGVHLWAPDEPPTPMIQAPMTTATFDATGQYLFTAHPDGSIRSWETDELFESFLQGARPTPRAVLDLRGGPGTTPIAIAAAPGGDRLAVAMDNGQIVVSRNAEEIERSLTAPGGDVSCLLFLSDEQLLSAEGHGALRFWNPSTGTLLGSSFGHGAKITDVSLFPGDRGFLTASEDRTLRHWPASPHPSVRILEGDATFDSTNGFHMAFSPSGDRFAWHVDGYRFQVVETRTGHPLFELAHEELEQNPMLNQVTFSRDGSRLYTSDVGHPVLLGHSRVRVWDREGSLLEERRTEGWCSTARLEGDVGLAAFNEPSAMPSIPMGTATEPSTLRIRELESWQLVSSFELEGFVDHMDFSGDGSRLILGVFGSRVLIADTGSGELLWEYRIETPGLGGASRTAVSVAADDSGSRFAFSLDDPADTRLFLVEPDVSPEPRILSNSLHVSSLSFRPTGDRLAVGTREGHLHLFCPERGAIVDLGGPNARLASVRYSPDGTILAGAHANGLHRILRVPGDSAQGER